MELNDYQRRAKTTAIYPGRGEVRGMAYTVMGLNGEAGKVAEQVKKILRDDDTDRLPERTEAIEHYLGACQWYIAAVAWEFGLDLDTIGEKNLQALADRLQRGVIVGDGRHR